MTTVWFPEVTVPQLSLSASGFVEETPFLPEADTEGVDH